MELVGAHVPVELSLEWHSVDEHRAELEVSRSDTGQELLWAEQGTMVSHCADQTWAVELAGHNTWTCQIEALRPWLHHGWLLMHRHSWHHRQALVVLLALDACLQPEQTE